MKTAGAFMGLPRELRTRHGRYKGRALEGSPKGGPSALGAIAASAKSAPNSYMAREPNAPSTIQSNDAPESRLFARSTLKRPDRPDRDEPARPKGQTRPVEERYLLRVDGQIKRSFSSKETAVTAGAKIKKAYPIVVVTVVDTEEHTTEIINA
jgi:hypothetical protein